MASDSNRMFAVNPKRDCPHVHEHIRPIPDGLTLNVEAPCKTCTIQGENWICLTCYAVECSRYLNCHMVDHNSQTKHAIAVSFSDLSVWCYACDSYIITPMATAVLQALAFAKFGPDVVASSQTLPAASSRQAAAVEARLQALLEEENDNAVPENFCYACETAHPPVDTWQSPSEATLPSTISVKSSVPSATFETLRDRIKGAIYGQALGDAIGLGTEFMFKKEAAAYYPNRSLTFDNFERDRHRSRWAKGDWTDDTDQMILILDGLLVNSGKFSVLDFARRIKWWASHGYPDLGDKGGMGIGMTVNNTINHRNFLDDPHSAAKDIWERTNRMLAANGAVMRTSILGIPNFPDPEAVHNQTRDCALITHADPRCVASCVTVTSAISYMLRHAAQMQDAADLSQVADVALQAGLAEFDREILAQSSQEGLGSRLKALIFSGQAHSEYLNRLQENKTEFQHMCTVKNVEELKLDEHDSIGYTHKCVGAGMWALHKILHKRDTATSEDFKNIVLDVVYEAGDADTNGCVAGSLMGAYMGFKKLPQDWLSALPHFFWLEAKVDALFTLLEI
eukprot:TRINITY_DN1335_c0_g1::TRINITY_DN1335_c0_g1_i1::g.19941::m.19941 TRINITY_DN1335_c0_g1::TRINITY_DN1335_c0_g1_i1::g.19941  ORF type:complete len:567 (-),score=87.18,sp/Q9Z2V5/HDAC6_MOUSE/45.45/5e-21,ADP_ribosyl_GH/PF03747.9/1.2e+03,ADP_ribosyl_GH/PF03747.9/9.1e-59,zf-UBP/PF02148.14/9.5e-17,zf-UBP/PF02148.14/3.2e+03 TRINITY_DN1335_c0_g1_i1:73-1773(-)